MSYNLLMPKTHIKRRFLAVPAILAMLAIASAVLLPKLVGTPQSEFKTAEAKVADFSLGTVAAGRSIGDRDRLTTDSSLRYESPEVATNQVSANAVGIDWIQAGGSKAEDEAAEAEAVPGIPQGGSAFVELRSFDGKAWSGWTGLSSPDDRRDDAPAVYSGILLTKNATKVQYRFVVSADATGRAPVISQPRLTFIDSTKGPDPTKASLASRLIGKKADALASGPRIISRTEWGAPEGESSPRWPPEYRALTQVIVHHTASTSGPDSAAAVRAIWYFHANSQGWGDIGYNYLVDLSGNIFQGRYYDQNYARSTNQDVVGGHAFGANYGTSGIATLGNFNDQSVSGAMLNQIGNIAGWKAMPYGTFNPGGNTVGHRDVGQTNCPGNNLYAALPTVRTYAGQYFDYYSKWQQYDYSYQGQGVNGSPGNTLNLRAFQTATVYVDLKNEGSTAWSNGNVRLGTDRPMDRGSQFVHSSWISGSRPASFAGRVEGGSLVATNTINPGQVGRFQFTVQAPNTEGSFAEYFQPVSEGYTWFVRNMGIYWVMNVTPDLYRYQWLGQQYGMATSPDTPGTATVTLKNVGNVDWSKTGANAVKLAPNRPNDRYSWLYHSSWLTPQRAATFAGKAQLDGSGNPVRDGSGNVVYDPAATTIAPGEAAHFIFTIKTPDRPVAVNEYFNLVAEGRAWMNDVGMMWPVSFPASNYQAQWAGQSGAPTIDKSVNGVGSIYFDWKNTGSYPWKKSDIVRLAPNNPNDRSSIFAALGLTGGQLPTNTANWLSPSRVGTFAGKVEIDGSLTTAATVINPGETGRFFVALDARNVPSRVQPYREYFRLVGEFFTWMEDYGAFLDIIVQD